MKIWACTFFLLIFNAGFAQSEFFEKLSRAALALTEQHVKYDPSYFSIAYPNGDVPSGRGVCTDVIIRAYRKLGVDLQKEVHEDMKRNFDAYPNKWGMHKTDTNIDHRRVPNLMAYFTRQHAAKPISVMAKDYSPGDVVAWDLGHGILHVGIVVNKKSADAERNLMVHNIGNGQEVSDCLLLYKIIGHYRFK